MLKSSNTNEVETEPETSAVASGVKITQNNASGKKQWTVMADGGKSVGLESGEIEGEKVKAIIYDEEGSPKMKVNAKQANLLRTQKKATLREDLRVTIAGGDNTIRGDKMFLQGEEPIRITGKTVQFLLSEDGSERINAKKAIITQDLKEITFYDLMPSPIDSQTVLEGGTMDIKIPPGKSSPDLVKVSGWVSITSQDVSCRSSLLTLQFKGGKPSMAIFTGSPIAKQGTRIIRANKIKYNLANGKITASGNVKSL